MKWQMQLRGRVSRMSEESETIQELNVRRIVVRDHAGTARIILDAGGPEGYAFIYLQSPDGRDTMQIGSQPSGRIVINFGDSDVTGMLAISGDGICLRAKDGRLGITIGRVDTDEETITVFRDGQRVWRSPQ
jgi:hypothetical protein